MRQLASTSRTTVRVRLLLPASASTVTCGWAPSAGEIESARPGSTTRSKLHPLRPLRKGNDAREYANGKIRHGTASQAARQCTEWRFKGGLMAKLESGWSVALPKAGLL